MPRLTNGPTFVPLPDHMFRRRPLVDPGLLALAGAIVALAFAALLLGLLENRLGLSLGNVVRAALSG